MRPVILPVLAALALVLAACGGDDDEPQATRPAPTATQPPATATAPPEPEPRLLRNRGGPKVQTVARGLEVPWEIGFLPDGRALITERGGSVRMLLPDGRLRTVGSVDVAATGEGGLLGLAVDPQFERNSFVYLYGSRKIHIIDHFKTKNSRIQIAQRPSAHENDFVCIQR